jgi:regulator of nonsense transcripts 1
MTGKWFCNGNVNPGGTCIVQHLVRGRYKEVRLHPESALGNTILECYHSGSRNVFALGFVPVKADDTMVLLTRDTLPTATCVKDLDLDLSLWEPIIQVLPPA